MTDFEFVSKLAEKVQSANGRVFYVGGFVRDKILGKENKDIDIEVHGISAETLRNMLSEFGPMIAEGSAFGVFRVGRYDVDIALPRKESCTGRGHKDFEVFVDPFVGEEGAARRRDFTINALMEDALTGEVLDFFGGQKDAEKKFLRHVDDASFGDDPLRVLRAAQFAARFDFSIAPETIDICRGMTLDSLSKERVWAEMGKALLKSKKPSVFFNVLREMDQLGTWFPELEELIGIEQDPNHHPEGDVWNHTMMVIDRAADLRGKAKQPLYFMLAAVCHDIGKPATTVRDEKGKIRALEHDEVGADIADGFLRRLSSEKQMIKYVKDMVMLHMRPNLYANAKAKQKSFNKMFDASVCPEDLLLLSKADRTGRLAGDYDENEAFLEERFKDFNEVMAQPFVAGKDLLDAGFAPGPDFSEWMAMAHKLRLAGVNKGAAIGQILATKKKAEKETRKLAQGKGSKV